MNALERDETDHAGANVVTDDELMELATRVQRLAADKSIEETPDCYLVESTDEIPPSDPIATVGHAARRPYHH